MLVDSLLGIFESAVKLGIAVLLVYTNKEKLVLYGLLMAGLTILIRIVKSIYCHTRYEECRIKIKSHIEIRLLKEMLSFAGWNVFGLSCSVLKNQGLAILLNISFGIVVNAAYGIANQVNSNLRQFSTNMIRAITPQITKSEGSGDRQRMLRLSILASKMSFFLLAFFAIPIIIEMPFILKIWLKVVPENSVIFCQFILVLSMLYQITIGTMTSVTSVGNIKRFQIAVGALEIFNLPVAYLLIKSGLPAYSVFVGAIVLEIIAGGIRTWYANKIAGLDLRDFLIGTWLYSMITAGIAIVLGLSWHLLFHQGIIRALIVGITTTITLMLFGKIIVLSKEEYGKIKEIVISFYGRLSKRSVVVGNI
jgi:O-antigen/teichoic acid export membrane protein